MFERICKDAPDRRKKMKKVFIDRKNRKMSQSERTQIAKGIAMKKGHRGLGMQHIEGTLGQEIEKREGLLGLETN